ncbi:hypothetical protein AKJ09_01890 [Labilithrix luteola]|uniref:Uncharacterized protein n=1 Tax=Labilithrix luteola TaxID=1391654 RepID=A0A0K1PPB7_9BACT|nr:hypothetical protein [Labilithrix luteola]AKU95226.1 hypothetical protein AKJ09_01890 [Labilithrix luteola]
MASGTGRTKAASASSSAPDARAKVPAQKKDGHDDDDGHDDHGALTAFGEGGIRRAVDSRLDPSREMIV